jgi:ABC-type Fe3+ transport system permease subunit
MTLPNELSDAAKLDGATEFGIYSRIVVPLSKPALVTVGLFSFVGSWNDFLGPLLYLNDERDYTLSLGLQRFVSQHGAEWSMLMAAATLMALPIIVIFFLAQRTIYVHPAPALEAAPVARPIRSSAPELVGFSHPSVGAPRHRQSLPRPGPLPTRSSTERTIRR